MRPSEHIKFAAKNLERSSKKFEREEKEEKTKLKNAIENGNMDKARSHAENAIQKKNESLELLRTIERIVAMAQKVPWVHLLNQWIPY